MREIISNPHMASHKMPVSLWLSYLNDYFWDNAGSLDGWCNSIIYKNQVSFLKEAISREVNPHTVASARMNLKGILNNKSEELITNLIDAGCMVGDTDKIPSYYLKISPILVIIKKLFKI